MACACPAAADKAAARAYPALPQIGAIFQGGDFNELTFSVNGGQSREQQGCCCVRERVFAVVGPTNKRWVSVEELIAARGCAALPSPPAGSTFFYGHFINVFIYCKSSRLPALACLRLPARIAGKLPAASPLPACRQARPCCQPPTPRAVLCPYRCSPDGVHRGVLPGGTAHQQADGPSQPRLPPAEAP